MRKIFFLCSLLLLFFDLYSQNTIKGKVTDEDNRPLPGATIFLPELNKGTMADDNGYYELSGLPSGKIKIQFSYIGYSNRIETIILQNPDTEVNAILETTTIITEEVVISAGYSSTQHENAIKIEALKLDFSEIKLTPNFSEIITKIPGVSMISKGSGVSKPVIRGLSMNDILILNNGVRFENYQYSDHHPLGIDEFGVEDIEVIKGPSSLLYGSDAIGGVINFIKEKPAPIGTIEGDYSMQLFSNTLGITNNFGIKGSSQHLFGGIRFGQKTNSDFLQGGGAFVPNTRFKEYSIKMNTGHTGRMGTFRLFYDYSQQNLGLAEEEAVESITKRGRNPKIFFQQFNSHLLSTQNKLYLGKMKLDINSAYQNTELIHFGEPSAYEIQMKLMTLTYDTKLYLPSNKNSEYIIGYQGMSQNNLNLNDREIKLLPDASVFNNSAFFLIQKTFFRRLKFQTGLRFDEKTITTKALGDTIQPDYREALKKRYNSFSGSLGAIYSVSEKLLLRSNFASAYRTPNLAELTSNGQHETRYEVGDKNLNPEKSFEFDLSLHYHIDNLTFDLAGFYNNINNYIFISPTGDTTTNGIDIYKYKQNPSYLFGGETGIHIHPEALKWLHLLTTFSTVTGKQEGGSYLPYIPAKKVYFEFRVEKESIAFINKAFMMITATSVFKQQNTAPEETPTNSYTLVDISVGGQIKVKNQFLSFSLGATNIFDKLYIDHLSTLKEVGFCNPGRNLIMTMKIPFIIRKTE
ncbi:MAG TPA: TonB-dependent receptor [Bacteroidales bacterium]|nr:TonB-dependent receptor [Bacteroidales bacterium]